jgi:hypothetical protein
MAAVEVSVVPAAGGTCVKAAVARKLRDRKPSLFNAFEIFDHISLPYSPVLMRFVNEETNGSRIWTSQRSAILLY